MKIAIDISSVVYGTGVSVYTKNLVKNLLKIDRENEYILFAGTLRRKKDILKFVNSLSGNFKVKILPIPPTIANFIWNHLHNPPIEIFIGKVDIFHSSDWAQPASNAFKITTIHDLSPVLLPQETPQRIVKVHKARLNWVKKEVDKIIVPSNATKKDLSSLGYKEDKIVVIPEAAEDFFKPSSKNDIKRIHKKYNLPEKYLLAVGTNPRKNLTRIEKAIKNIPIPLRVVGRDFSGFVPDRDLVALYSGAEALVYPSLLEGFGLPVLEAMKCGCPVVTSNLSSLKEISRDAAVLVDPYSIPSIASGIKKAISNRDILIKKGYKEANKYSWENTAKITLEVYKTCQTNTKT